MLTEGLQLILDLQVAVGKRAESFQSCAGVALIAWDLPPMRRSLGGLPAPKLFDLNRPKQLPTQLSELLSHLQPVNPTRLPALNHRLSWEPPYRVTKPPLILQGQP